MNEAVRVILESPDLIWAAAIVAGALLVAAIVMNLGGRR